jgi:hypothetical protein
MSCKTSDDENDAPKGLVTLQNTGMHFTFERLPNNTQQIRPQPPARSLKVVFIKKRNILK